MSSLEIEHAFAEGADDETSTAKEKENQPPMIFARGSFEAELISSPIARYWASDRIEKFFRGEPVREEIPYGVTLEEKLKEDVWPAQDWLADLIVSELTANVMRHATPPTTHFTVELGVVKSPSERKGHLFIGVSDAEPKFKKRTQSTSTSEEHRGMELLEGLGALFGWTPIMDGDTAVGKRVFFEVGPPQIPIKVPSPRDKRI